MIVIQNKQKLYTTQLQAGLGLVEETKLTLSIYEPGMTTSTLYEKALSSGLFPQISARRLRNIISECFAPRYLKTNAAQYLKPLDDTLQNVIFKQFLLVYTALANQILLDFIKNVYWHRYASGQNVITSGDAQDFVRNSVLSGKTQKPWSESTIKRVSSYLIGCCADYGLLTSNRSAIRQFQSIRLHEYTLLFFAHCLHFQGIGDNSIINHEIWSIFGLEPTDVRDELKQISKRGWLIVQSAGDVTRISWCFKNLEEVLDVIIKG